MYPLWQNTLLSKIQMNRNNDCKFVFCRIQFIKLTYIQEYLITYYLLYNKMYIKHVVSINLKDKTRIFKRLMSLFHWALPP